jgi:hypothetical protein
MVSRLGRLPIRTRTFPVRGETTQGRPPKGRSTGNMSETSPGGRQRAGSFVLPSDTRHAAASRQSGEE